LSREIVERDAEIERLTTELKRAVEHGIRLLEQLAQRDAEVERLKAEGQLDYDGMREFQARYIAADQRAEAAEARVYLTPEAMESMTAVMKIGAEYAEEVKTLRARVAELEERLLMMCVAQINGAELQQVALTDREMLLEIMKDLEFTVWNCEQCGHAESTSTMDVAYMLRDYLKTAPPLSKQSRPSPDPPAPATLAAQGVEGEPHHER